MDPDLEGGSEQDNGPALHEIERLKETTHTQGYQSGLVTTIEKIEVQQTLKGITTGFDEVFPEEYQSARVKAASLLKKLD